MGSNAATAKTEPRKAEDFRLSPVLKDFASQSTTAAIGFFFILPFVAIATCVLLLLQFLKSPLTFFQRRARKPDELEMPGYLHGLQHEYVETAPGVELHIVSFGRHPDRPLMLFLHGFPECWYSWRHQLAHFRHRYEVVAVDMRGFNTSSKPKGIRSYSMEHLSADVAAVVRARGRSSCTLVAHDWGGSIAWTVAGRYPGLVDRLLVLGGPHPLLYERNMTVEQMLRSSYFAVFFMPLLPNLLLLGHSCGVLDTVWLSRHPLFSPKRADAASPADVAVYKAALLQRGACSATLNYYRAAMLESFGLLPIHPEIEIATRRQLDLPVLLVWAADDAVLALSCVRDVDQVAPKVETHVVPNCSHWVPCDQASDVNRIMDEWLLANPL